MDAEHAHVSIPLYPTLPNTTTVSTITSCREQVGQPSSCAPITTTQVQQAGIAALLKPCPPCLVDVGRVELLYFPPPTTASRPDGISNGSASSLTLNAVADGFTLFVSITSSFPVYADRFKHFALGIRCL